MERNRRMVWYYTGVFVMRVRRFTFYKLVMIYSPPFTTLPANLNLSTAA